MAAINNFVVVVADARYIWEMKGVDDAFWQLIWQSTIGGAKYFDDFIVKKCMAKDLERRPGSMRNVLRMVTRLTK